MKTVGVIRQLARYPVKSMQGESVQALRLTLQGFEEDRRYAFVQAESRSAFPWLTAREFPEMLHWKTSVQGSGTTGVAVTVTTASGATWPVASEELRGEIESRSGRPVFLLRDHRGSYDNGAVSLISRQTVARIAAETGTHENPFRYRPNIVADLEAGLPDGEIAWVGKTLRLGETARIAVTEADERCVLINVDPDTLQPNPEVLKCVVQQHHKCAGVYAAVLAPGIVRTGDAIVIED